MVKVISLSNRAYTTLSNIKGENESFSDTVIRVAEKEKKVNIMELFDMWPGSKSELDNIKRIIYKDRKTFRLKEVKF